MALVHRIRAGLVVGVLWAIPWGLVTMTIGVVQLWSLMVSFHVPPPPWTSVLLTGFRFGAICGFVAGSVFALALSGAARGRQVSQLSTGRAAMLGAVASATLALGLAAILFSHYQFALRPIGLLVVACGVLGAASSWAMVTTGKRAPDLPRMDDSPRLLHE